VPGKTLLTATEQPAGYLKASDILNALISGDKQKVERKFKDAFDMYPKAKLLWAMNDVPRIPSANDGLFRRVKVIEIESIPEGERVPGVKEGIKEEGAGILVWALEGLHRLRRRGRFEIPASVRAATERFRMTNDVPAMFVQEACTISTKDEGCEEQAQKLYSAYKCWCATNGHKPLSSTKMAAEWRRLGFGERHLHGRKYYTGVKLNSDWVEYDGPWS
jgi:putative DNA primase/helicase